jgi:hypothetical protein
VIVAGETPGTDANRNGRCRNQLCDLELFSRRSMSLDSCPINPFNSDTAWCCGIARRECAEKGFPAQFGFFRWINFAALWRTCGIFCCKIQRNIIKTLIFENFVAELCLLPQLRSCMTTSTFGVGHKRCATCLGCSASGENAFKTDP